MVEASTNNGLLNSSHFFQIIFSMLLFLLISLLLSTLQKYIIYLASIKKSDVHLIFIKKICSILISYRLILRAIKNSSLLTLINKLILKSKKDIKLFFSSINKGGQKFMNLETSLPKVSGLPFLGYLPFLGRLPHATLAKLANRLGGRMFELNLGGGRRVVVLSRMQQIDEIAKKFPEELIGKPTTFTTSQMTLGAHNDLLARWRKKRSFMDAGLRSIERFSVDLIIDDEVAGLVAFLQKHTIINTINNTRGNLDNEIYYKEIQTGDLPRIYNNIAKKDINDNSENCAHSKILDINSINFNTCSKNELNKFAKKPKVCQDKPPNITNSLFSQIKVIKQDSGKKMLDIDLKDQCNNSKEIVQHIVNENVGIDSNHLDEDHVIDVRHYITYFVSRVIYRICYGQIPDDATNDFLRDISHTMSDYTTAMGSFSIIDLLPASLSSLFLRGKLSRFLSFNQKLTRFCCNTTKLCESVSALSDSLFQFIKDRSKRIKVEKLDLDEHKLYEGLEDIMRAGTESTALIIQWCLLYLAKYPDIQKKMQIEIKKNSSHCMNPNEVISSKNMPYCQAVLAETMRCCSLNPILKRQLTASITLKDGLTLPKGTVMLFNNFALNNDPQVWTNPQIFKPERFIAKKVFNDRLITSSVNYREKKTDYKSMEITPNANKNVSESFKSCRIPVTTQLEFCQIQTSAGKSDVCYNEIINHEGNLKQQNDMIVLPHDVHTQQIHSNRKTSNVLNECNDDDEFDKDIFKRLLTFGFGKRRCIGKVTGQNLCLSAIVSIVANFEVSCPEIQDWDAALEPINGIGLSPKPYKIGLRPVHANL